MGWLARTRSSSKTIAHWLPRPSFQEFSPSKGTFATPSDRDINRYAEVAVDSIVFSIIAQAGVRPPNPQLLHPRLQSAALQSEQNCCALGSADHPVSGIQSRQNMAPLAILERF